MQKNGGKGSATARHSQVNELYPITFKSRTILLSLHNINFRHYTLNDYYHYFTPYLIDVTSHYRQIIPDHVENLTNQSLSFPTIFVNKLHALSPVTSPQRGRHVTRLCNSYTCLLVGDYRLRSLKFGAFILSTLSVILKQLPTDYILSGLYVIIYDCQNFKKFW